MTIKTSSSKFANYLQLFRIKQFSQLSFVYRPVPTKQREEMIELIKQKISILLDSEYLRKLRIAKDFYRLEMSLPRFDEFKQIQEDVALVKEFMKKGCYKYITVRQAWLLFLVSLEIGLWFFLGETIGKFHIVGYKV